VAADHPSDVEEAPVTTFNAMVLPDPVRLTARSAAARESQLIAQHVPAESQGSVSVAWYALPRIATDDLQMLHDARTAWTPGSEIPAGTWRLMVEVQYPD
jgi:hypothetical protein